MKAGFGEDRLRSQLVMLRLYLARFEATIQENLVRFGYGE